VKKNKKDLGPTDKIYSLDEMDEATLERFQSGTLQGMYECHEVVTSEIARLRCSLEDVWSIEYSGAITPDKQARVDKLTFAVDTLVTLQDMVQGAYDTKLDALKREVSYSDYEEYHYGNPT
jgi:hypothetical protein